MTTIKKRDKDSKRKKSDAYTLKLIDSYRFMDRPLAALINTLQNLVKI